jgi:magnesium-transporting ATPase (P-type)
MPVAKAQSTWSWWFLIAAALSLITTAIHVLAGTPEIMSPLLASNLPPVVKGVFDVMWHQITALLLIGSSASLVAAARPSWRLPVAILIGGQFTLIAVLFFGLGLMWFSSPWPMPQWVLFGTMAMLLVVGSRRSMA